jgi:hypothetical protein
MYSAIAAKKGGPVRIPTFPDVLVSLASTFRERYLKLSARRAEVWEGETPLTDFRSPSRKNNTHSRTSGRILQKIILKDNRPMVPKKRAQHRRIIQEALKTQGLLRRARKRSNNHHRKERKQINKEKV